MFLQCIYVETARVFMQSPAYGKSWHDTKYCFAQVPHSLSDSRRKKEEDNLIPFCSTLPAHGIWTIFVQCRINRTNKTVQLLTSTYMPWEVDGEEVILGFRRINYAELVWESCIFSARIFSSLTKELARKCRMFSLNYFLKGFSKSSSHSVPLRKAEVIHCEKYVVFTISFLCFGPKQGNLSRSDSMIIIGSLVIKSKEQLDSTEHAHLFFQCIRTSQKWQPGTDRTS